MYHLEGSLTTIPSDGAWQGEEKNSFVGNTAYGGYAPCMKDGFIHQSYLTSGRDKRPVSGARLGIRQCRVNRLQHILQFGVYLLIPKPHRAITLRRSGLSLKGRFGNRPCLILAEDDSSPRGLRRKIISIFALRL
jgi:hypothetical protein